LIFTILQEIYTKTPMDLKETFDQAEGLIRQGETGKALNLLYDALNQRSEYGDTLRLLAAFEANYNHTRQQEMKSILSFQEAQQGYGKINDALLSTLADLKAGKKPGAPRQIGSTSQPMLLWAGITVIALIILFFAYKNTRSEAVQPEKQEAKQPGKELVQCPNFKGEGKKILLLPFQKVSGDDTHPELLIRARIQDLSTKNNFPIDVEIAPNYDVNTRNPDLNEATALGLQCNTEMVIWGFFAGSDKGSQIQLNARFVMPKLKREGGTGFKKLADIVDIVADPAFRSIDDAVFSLCGLMALDAGNKDLARKWFEKIKEKDARDEGALKELNN
jgi:hypothetical protein